MTKNKILWILLTHEFIHVFKHTTHDELQCRKTINYKKRVSRLIGSPPIAFHRL